MYVHIYIYIYIYKHIYLYTYVNIYTVSYREIFSYHSYPISMGTQMLRPNIRARLSKDLRPGWKVHKPV